MRARTVQAVALLLALAACDHAVGEGSVDTTLPNGTAAIDNIDTMPVDNTAVVDMNAAGDTDTMATDTLPTDDPGFDNMDRMPAPTPGDDQATRDGDTVTVPTINTQQP